MRATAAASGPRRHWRRPRQQRRRWPHPRCRRRWLPRPQRPLWQPRRHLRRCLAPPVDRRGPRRRRLCFWRTAHPFIRRLACPRRQWPHTATAAAGGGPRQPRHQVVRCTYRRPGCGCSMNRCQQSLCRRHRCRRRCRGSAPPSAQRRGCWPGRRAQRGTAAAGSGHQRRRIRRSSDRSPAYEHVCSQCSGRRRRLFGTSHRDRHVW